MIRIRGNGQQGFFAAFMLLRSAGVDVQPRGANRMVVPGDTDRVLLRRVVESGLATVDADLTTPTPSTVAPAEPAGVSAATGPDQPQDATIPEPGPAAPARTPGRNPRAQKTTRATTRPRKEQ